MIAGNGFGKIPQWFKGNGNDGFVVAVLTLVASWFAGSCKKYIFFIYFIYGFNISNSGSGQPLYSSSSLA